MKTPDEIKKGLECCTPVWAGNHWKTCNSNCPYIGLADSCRGQLVYDALAYIQQLEAKVPKWISVKERLPETEGKYIVCTAKGQCLLYTIQSIRQKRGFSDGHEHPRHPLDAPAGAAEGGSVKLHIDFRSSDEERKRHCGNCGNREVDGVNSHCKFDGSRIGYCDMEFRWCRRWRRNRKFDNVPEPPEEEE